MPKSPFFTVANMSFNAIHDKILTKISDFTVYTLLDYIANDMDPNRIAPLKLV